jgi:hypothetical protein
MLFIFFMYSVFCFYRHFLFIYESLLWLICLELISGFSLNLILNAWSFNLSNIFGVRNKTKICYFHRMSFRLFFFLSAPSFTCFSHLYQSLLDHLSAAFNLIICSLYLFYLLITCLNLLLACLQSFLPSLSVDSSIISITCFYLLVFL